MPKVKNTDETRFNYLSHHPYVQESRIQRRMSITSMLGDCNGVSDIRCGAEASPLGINLSLIEREEKRIRDTTEIFNGFEELLSRILRWEENMPCSVHSLRLNKIYSNVSSIYMKTLQYMEYEFQERMDSSDEGSINL